MNRVATAGVLIALLIPLTVPLTVAATTTIVVTGSIQSAVDAAVPGSTVLVPPGTYHETVVIATDGLTIIGSPGAVLDGSGLGNAIGILVAPRPPAATINRFRLRGMRVQNYGRDGVHLLHVVDFSISGGTYVNNGNYGIYPIFSAGGSITGNRASGSDDTGIYVGQSSDVQIAGNVVTGNTVGFDIENSSDIVLVGNQATGNSIGALVQVSPGLAVTSTSSVLVAKNLLTSNNQPNPVTDPTDLLSRLPSGLGLLVIAADRVTITANVVGDNDSSGIAVVQLPPDVAALDPRIEPFPDDDHITRNIALRNGREPDPRLAPFPAVDVLWDGSGTGNCWSANVHGSSFPSALPAC